MATKTDLVLVNARRRCLEAGVPWTPELLDVFRAVVHPLVQGIDAAEADALESRRRLEVRQRDTGVYPAAAG